jgi:hypothetical protein
MTPKCLIAGIDERGPLSQGKMRGTLAEVDEAIHDAGRTRFMIGSECTIAPETPAELISAVRDFVAQI